LLDKTLSDQARHRIEEITKAGQRAAAVTHQLLAFSRKQVLETRILDLNALVRNTIGMLQRLLGEDVALVTEFDANLGMVKADATQLEQIIMNLAVNARDAMPHGGKLIIHTSNAELDAAYGERHMHVPSGDYVMLEITDNGSGMDAETQGQIFEPFFTTKETDRGTGLGLATVYGIVKQSGGYIWVYSEVGFGTTFKIYLPRVQGIADALARPHLPAAIERGCETILLVEDDAALRALDRELVYEMGYAVLDASNGSEALKLADKNSGTIHLLMVDVIMPGMSGKQLADELLQSRPNTKVLFVSGYTNNVIQRVLSNPGAAFLQKPFTRETLSKKLREVLDSTLEPSAAGALAGLRG
jgi:CheY-like chemotaxis protein/two-component sensor histidine kinase